MNAFALNRVGVCVSAVLLASGCALTPQTLPPEKTALPLVSEARVEAGNDMARGAIGAALQKDDRPYAQEEDGIDSMLASARARVRGATEWLARGIDGWFGDVSHDDRSRVANGSIGINTLWRQDQPFKANLRFRARLDLPNLEEKTYLFFGQDNERDLVTGRPETFSQQQQLLAESRRQDQTFFAGLGVGLKDNIDFRVGTRGYNLYTQARYRKEWWLSGHDRVEFREIVFWTVKDGFGATTALDYEHAFSPSLSFRWRNVGTVSQKTNGFAWNSSLGAFQAFGDQKLASLEAVISGESGSSVGVAEYGVRASWRQAVYRDWLLGEVIVGHFWPRHEEAHYRARSWGIGFGLEMLF